jgi:ribosomal protein S18 acetylase RimI-like enzyme
MGEASDRPEDPNPTFIRVGTVADAMVAGRLHAEQITTGFLSFLGPRFLYRLYRRVVLWEGGLLLVAVDPSRGSPNSSGAVVGFIASANRTGALYKTFLLHDSIPAALGAAGPLLRSWRRVAETMRHGSSGGTGVGRGAEVLAMAVDSGSQGKGLGRDLVAAFLDSVLADGGRQAYTVIAEDNAASLALYRRSGFVPGPAFELHAGTTSLVMQWDAPA